MFTPSDLLRESLKGMSRSAELRKVIEKAPVGRGVVQRFTAGESVEQVTTIAKDLAGRGFLTSIDYLGEGTTDQAHAERTKDSYLELLDSLQHAGLTEGGTTEVSVKLSALGQALGPDGEDLATRHAREIARAATNAGTTATLDMEDHTTTDSTLGVLAELRKDFPATGGVLQSYLYRTEEDCHAHAGAGSRIRLCKGTYAEPPEVAYQEKHDVDLAYVRCLKVLMEGQGYPMVATHDPRMVEIAHSLATQVGRERGSFEYQFLYGIRPELQQQLVDRGEKVRIYLPFGDEWYGYLMRRMAERPANLKFFLRALATR